MKKVLFTAYNLDVGGIETSLINILKALDSKEYDITLILEKKEGLFLSEVPKNVKVIEHKLSYSKDIVKRKLINKTNMLKLKKEIYKKYDFSASFATYSKMGSKIALYASDNNAIWMHCNYLDYYNGQYKKMLKFLNGVNVTKFKHVVFVSKENYIAISKYLPSIKDKYIVCNNLIDGEKILKLSKEKVDLDEYQEPIFVNVGRHEERQKRLFRLIESCETLNKAKKKYSVLLIGDGPDRKMYEDYVKMNNIKNIYFLGKKINPFPYYKASKCVILTSDYEGYPVVFNEAMILDKPIITTMVSDYKSINKGFITKKDIDDIKDKMVKIIDGYEFENKEKFDYKKYNEDNKNILLNLINNK